MIKKKSLGQYFLNSPKIIADIVSSGKVKSGDVVMEVGPGNGVLTSALLKTGVHVVAVEKDDRLVPILQEKFAKEIFSKQLELIHADILNCNLNKITKKSYKVIANIPYYITGQVIRMFLTTNKQPESMVLLLQKEVAERIVAKPAHHASQGTVGGDKKESLLSLSVKIYGEPKLIRTIGRGAFTPQPNVDSAVLCIENISRKKLVGVDEKTFFTILHAGFAHKRKQLLPNLCNLYKKDDLIRAFYICDIDLQSRAEDLSLEVWIKLCKHLYNLKKQYLSR